MSFSSGTYSLYATGNPVVTNTTISSTWANNTLNDIATALSTCMLKDGTQTATASIPFAEGLSVASGKTLTLTGATVAGQPTWSSAQTIPGIVLSGNITESGARAITITGALSAGAISGTTVALGTNPADSGSVRIPNTGGVNSRNAANSGNISLVFATAADVVNVGNGAAVTIPGTLGVTGMATLPWATSSIAYSAGDTTPSVLNASSLAISNAAPTTITNFDDGIGGQVIVLYFADSNTTINRDNAYLAGGVNFTGSVADILVLMKIGSIWYEVSRSVNS